MERLIEARDGHVLVARLLAPVGVSKGHIHMLHGMAEHSGRYVEFAQSLVADGFTGNIILKTVEGMGLAIFAKLKDVFYRNTASKLAALVLKPGLRAFKDTMDYSKMGGAPIIGLKKPVMKAHGSSNGYRSTATISIGQLAMGRIQRE